LGYSLLVIRSLPARLWRVAVLVDRTEEESVDANGDERAVDE
jgi:hypothetical protein